MFYYTYILKSEKDGNFYTGYTKNLEQRFENHQKGQVESTKNRRPLQLIYYEACLNKADAIHREKYSPCGINRRFSFAIQQGKKTYHGKMFLKNRLKSYFNRVNEARETNYWLRVIKRMNWLLANQQLESTLSESSELVKIFGKIFSGRK